MNLDRAHVDIAHNYVVRDGQRRLKGTKTDTERRLSLDDSSVQILRDFRSQREAAVAPGRATLASNAFLFSADPTCSRPWHPDHFTHLYRHLAASVGIVEPLKNLRHFNATQLLAAGVDLRTTAGRLGHGDGGATTLKVYASWMQEVDRSAADTLSQDLMALRIKTASPRSETHTLQRVAKPVSEVLRASAVVTYKDIAASLCDALAEGRLGNGDPLPTLSEVAAFYGVARSTAQRAVSDLAVNGQIVRSGNRWWVS